MVLEDVTELWVVFKKLKKFERRGGNLFLIKDGALITFFY
jgi:hypothetical protein